MPESKPIKLLMTVMCDLRLDRMLKVPVNFSYITTDSGMRRLKVDLMTEGWPSFVNANNVPSGLTVEKKQAGSHHL